MFILLDYNLAGWFNEDGGKTGCFLQSNRRFNILEKEMSNVRLIRSTILASVLFLSISQSGCSVFSAIGGWISESYDDTVAYFNAYYNAKRLFDDAEAEVLSARATLKSKSAAPNQPAAAGSTAKQKFTAVIDKCSNVLSFYPKSSVVDDALILIGKSYFYQDEFVKAERKFTELLAKNPKQSVAFEAQLWLLKTLDKENKFDEAIRVGQDLATSAAEAGKEDIAGEALMILGDIAAYQKNTDVAIDEYAKAVAESGDGVMKAAAQMKVGDLYFAVPDNDKAAAAYLEVQKYSPDDFTLYDSQRQAAIAFRRAGKTEQSVEVLRSMQSNYRFLENKGAIQYELGVTLEKGGKFDEAIDLYRLVDTTNAKTEAGAKAAFELGRLYQYDLGKYPEARIAYSHASVGGSPELTKDAAKRVLAFESYFRLQYQFLQEDSILAILDVDSLWLAKKDTLALRTKLDSLQSQATKESTAGMTRRGRTVPSGGKDPTQGSPTDSVLAVSKKDSSLAAVKSEAVRPKDDSSRVLARKDTLSTHRDSTAVKALASSMYVPRPKRDTLIASLGKLSYLLGELFFTELEVPDSTFYWVNQSLKLGIDSIKTPRALYVLSEVARGSTNRKYGDEKDLYRTLVEKHPKSLYAEEARIALGFRPTLKSVDPAGGVYAVAESLMYAGQYQRALDSLGRVVAEFGESPLVPKCRYTMGWIYEQYLSKPDSALSQYKTLAEKFASTRYGLAAQKRIPPPEAPAKPAADSTKKVLPDSLRKVGANEMGKTAVDSTTKGPGVPKLKLPIDSTDERRANPKLDSVRVKFDPNSIQKRQSEVDTAKGVGRKEK